MNNVKKYIPYIVGVLLIMFLSTFLPTEQPVISVRAEPLHHDPILGGLIITNSLLTSWLVIIFITVMCLVILGVQGSAMKMYPSKGQNLLEFMYEGIYNLTENVAGPKNAKRFFFVPATLFVYILVSNWIALFPGFPLLGVGVCEPHHYEESDTELVVEAEEHSDSEAHAEGEEDHSADEEYHGEGEGHYGESKWWTTCEPGEHVVPLIRSPSADLNNTLSLALISQVVAQVFGIMALGAAGYFGKFFVFGKIASAKGAGETAIAVIDVLVGLLEFLSEFIKVAAYTFRLYGNIFAGEVTVMILTFFVPLILAIPMLGFEIFVGFIQAFVFYILSVAFYTMAVSSHGEEGH